MSKTVQNLMARRAAWPHLAEVYAWAIHEAREADYRARVASDAVQAGIPPTYPTIVELLASAPWDGGEATR